MKAKLLRLSAADFVRSNWHMYFKGQRDGTKQAGEDIPKATFIKALGLLDEKLGEAGEQVTFLCVGGAAMMLVFGTRSSTQDIDGRLDTHDADVTKVFYRLAEEVAQEIGIASDWINTQVKDIMAGQTFKRSHFESVPEYTWPNLEMLFAKPGYLLSMKCQAMRLGKHDFSDIVNLLRLLDIRTLDALHEELDRWGTGWDFIGNDEFPRLKLSIAWAFPGQTEYDYVRVRALEQRRQQRG